MFPVYLLATLDCSPCSLFYSVRTEVVIAVSIKQCLMYKPHRKPWPKSKTSDISKQSSSPLHHTFLLGRARFNAQPLSALLLPLPIVPRALSFSFSPARPQPLYNTSFSLSPAPLQHKETSAEESEPLPRIKQCLAPSLDKNSTNHRDFLRYS